jgi:hypothetical protein
MLKKSNTNSLNIFKLFRWSRSHLADWDAVGRGLLGDESMPDHGGAQLRHLAKGKVSMQKKNL